MNKSKMAILFGLMYDSPILVLDEPYMGLDAFARDALGLVSLGVVPSKVKGPKGNQEYLAVLGPGEAS